MVRPSHFLRVSDVMRNNADVTEVATGFTFRLAVELDEPVWLVLVNLVKLVQVLSLEPILEAYACNISVYPDTVAAGCCELAIFVRKVDAVTHLVTSGVNESSGNDTFPFC
jgi:hypothetical protein